MKNLVRTYAPTLTGHDLSRGTKIFRWVFIVLYLAGMGLNLYLGIRNAIRGNLSCIVSFVAAAFVVAMLFLLFRAWKMTDDSRRKRRLLIAELDREMVRARRHSDDRDVIPVTEPEDAADPFAYAMMRAMKEGGGVHIVRGEDGLWRDGSTEQVIPIQDEGSGPEKGAER